MTLYNNFDDETKVHVLWKKSKSMFKTMNALNKVFVFKKIIRLRYHDGSSMATTPRCISRVDQSNCLSRHTMSSSR